VSAPGNVADLVARAAADHGQRPALTESAGDSRLPWAEVEGAVARGAGVLRTHGIRSGDRVAVVLPNCPAFATAYWAVLRAGGVVVPINPAYTAPEIAHMVHDAGVRLIVADPRLCEVAAAAADTAAAARPTGAAGAPPATVLDANALRDGDPSGGPIPVAPAGDPRALICYTSGTTGRPKGAVLTHANLLTNLSAFGDLARLCLEAEDVLYGLLPFFHIFGLNVILNAAARAGAEVVTVERFSPAGSLAALVEHGVTVAYGAPPVFGAWCALSPPTGGLPALRGAVSGADSLPVTTFEAFRDRYGLEILEGYGLTETSPVLTSTAGSPEVRPGTVGHPVAEVEIRVVQPSGADAPPGTTGEIVARGPSVFSGYHEQPQATEDAFLDDWFRTGDLGALDGDGYLAIRGRLKDMLIVSGFNVYPREVEEALLTHPAVAEAAVIGVPDARTGEKVRAVVVARTGAAVTAEALTAHCRTRLARYKIPREIELVGSLPRTPLGKLARVQLRAG
jgi:long-chain acyl-CoA synthetase